MKNATIKYLKAKIKAIKEDSKLRYITVQEAVKIAKDTQEKRLDGMNAFRDTLKDSNLEFVKKAQHDTEMIRVQDDIKVLRESKSFLEGKASLN